MLKVCQSCGTDAVTNTARFCRTCGALLTDPVNEDETIVAAPPPPLQQPNPATPLPPLSTTAQPHNRATGQFATNGLTQLVGNPVGNPNSPAAPNTTRIEAGEAETLVQKRPPTHSAQPTEPLAQKYEETQSVVDAEAAPADKATLPAANYNVANYNTATIHPARPGLTEVTAQTSSLAESLQTAAPAAAAVFGNARLTEHQAAAQTAASPLPQRQQQQQQQRRPKLVRAVGAAMLFSSVAAAAMVLLWWWSSSSSGGRSTSGSPPLPAASSRAGGRSSSIIRQQAVDKKLLEAEAALASGNVSAAILQLREAIKLDSTNSEAHRKLGDALLRSGDRQAALNEYRIATQHDPNNTAAWRALASAQAPEAVAPSSPEFVDGAPADPEQQTPPDAAAAAVAALPASDRYSRGLALWLSDRVQAVEEFRAAAAEIPDAHYYLGLNIAEGQDPKMMHRADLLAALEHFQRARSGSFAQQALQYEERLGREYDRRRQQQ